MSPIRTFHVSSSWSSSGIVFSAGLFTFIESLKYGCKSVGKSSPRHVCGCSMRVLLVPSHGFSCVVLAVLTTRLKDSADHPSARNALAVATLIVTGAGPLRTNTLGSCWISSRSPNVS